MTQSWHELLFAHWPIDPRDLRPKIPAAFDLDTFQGLAWIGVVPFRMTNVTLRGVPPLPWLSAFPELNVRTYVRSGSRRGVYFFSLDASRRLAVLGARLLNLPYYTASMSVVADARQVRYESRRRKSTSAQLRCTYGRAPTGRPAAPGSLGHFLIERYRLYHLDRRGAPFHIDIHHPPWQLSQVEAAFDDNTMAAANNIDLPDTRPLLHYSARQDVLIWGRRSDSAR